SLRRIGECNNFTSRVSSGPESSWFYLTWPVLQREFPEVYETAYKINTVFGISLLLWLRTCHCRLNIKFINFNVISSQELGPELRQQNCPRSGRAAEITSSDRGDWQSDDLAGGVLLGSRGFALSLDRSWGEPGSGFPYLSSNFVL